MIIESFFITIRKYLKIAFKDETSDYFCGYAF